MIDVDGFGASVKIEGSLSHFFERIGVRLIEAAKGGMERKPRGGFICCCHGSISSLKMVTTSSLLSSVVMSVIGIIHDSQANRQANTI